MKNWIENNQLNWAFLDQQTFIAALKNCPQDKEWHAEGNVYVHTRMVVDALLRLPEYAQLSQTDQYILQLAALLHDIAKPQCTVEENGRIVSPRHAKIGEKVARDLLWDLDFELREQICSLVRFHGLPLWSLQKNNPNSEVIASSLRVRNELIYILSKADVLGRICSDADDLLERLEYFKELSIENKCFTQMKGFNNSHSRFQFFAKNSEFPAQLFDDTEFEIILLSGIPGSGKDTAAAQIDLPMISLDDLRREMKVKQDDKVGQAHVIQAAYAQAKIYAAKKQSFVWNSTNLTKDLRAKLITILSVYNPKFRIIYVETSRKNVQHRREADIPKSVLEKMYRLLEMPQLTEAHEVEYRRS